MHILRSSSLALAGATLAIVLSVSTMTASAASTFLLQFGQHPTEDAARTQWDELQREHPELLSGLNLHITPVAGQYRTQASGVASRENAQNTCNRLSVADVPCYVVETSMFQPQQMASAPVAEVADAELYTEPYHAGTAAADAAEARDEVRIIEESVSPVRAHTADNASAFASSASVAAAPLPWLQQEEATEQPAVQVASATAQPAQQQVERAAAVHLSESLPQQPSSEELAARAPRNLQAPAHIAANHTAAPANLVPQTPQPDAAARAEAHIEVAEAIQVPLSFGNTAPTPVNRPAGQGGFPSQPQAERTTWVQLSYFVNREAAMNYWRQMTVQNPELQRLLRVRIISPWRAPGMRGDNRASLRIGPFANQGELSNLCAVAAERGLRCSLVQEVGGTVTANTVRSQASGAEAHSRRAAQNRGYSRTPGAAASGMYWLQLGAFGSVGEAQNRWGALNSTHGDLLGRMQPQVSYPALSSSPTPVYHLRTGPFVSQSSATSLCNSLHNRHVGCVVVQAR